MHIIHIMLLYTLRSIIIWKCISKLYKEALLCIHLSTLSSFGEWSQNRKCVCQIKTTRVEGFSPPLASICTISPYFVSTLFHMLAVSVTHQSGVSWDHMTTRQVWTYHGYAFKDIRENNVVSGFVGVTSEAPLMFLIGT